MRNMIIRIIHERYIIRTFTTHTIHAKRIINKHRLIIMHRNALFYYAGGAVALYDDLKDEPQVS